MEQDRFEKYWVQVWPSWRDRPVTAAASERLAREAWNAALSVHRCVYDRRDADGGLICAFCPAAKVEGAGPDAEATVDGAKCVVDWKFSADATGAMQPIPCWCKDIIDTVKKQLLAMQAFSVAFVCPQHGAMTLDTRPFPDVRATYAQELPRRGNQR